MSALQCARQAARPNLRCGLGTGGSFAGKELAVLGEDRPSGGHRRRAEGGEGNHVGRGRNTAPRGENILDRGAGTGDAEEHGLLGESQRLLTAGVALADSQEVRDGET